MSAFSENLPKLLAESPILGVDGAWIPSIMPTSADCVDEIRAWLCSPIGQDEKRANPSGYSNVCAYLIERLGVIVEVNR